MPETPAAARSKLAPRRRATAVLLAAVLLGNAAVIIWLWVHGGNLHPHSTGDLLTGIGRLTGLLGAYLALIQVVLLARLPPLERLVGFDRLTVWHRWNGHACIDLILAHVVFTVWGYALVDRFPLSKEISTMLGGGIYPGMITATVGDGAVDRRRRHLARGRTPPSPLRVVVRGASAGLRGDRAFLVPRDPDRQRARARAASPPTTGARCTSPRSSCWCSGGCWSRSLARFATACASPRSRSKDPESCRCASRGATSSAWARSSGQFFLWRFLARRSWGTAHPFSLSAAPDERLASHHGEGARRPYGAHRADPARHARARGGPVRRLHRRAPAPRQGRTDRGRHRDHSDPRSAWRRWRATSSSSTGR